MTYQIEIDPESAEALVVRVLLATRENFTEYVEKRQSGEEDLGMFHDKRNKDIRAIMKHIRALDRVLELYSVRVS
jgi:hypothetical protein